MSLLKATTDDVRYAYRLLLGREPDPRGLADFKVVIDSQSLTTSCVADLVMQSDEYKALRGVAAASAASAAEDVPVQAPLLVSQACTYGQIRSANFLHWARQIRDRPGKPHRKLWEWCYIIQALHERGMLGPGRRGLGFAVGQEPLTSLFASKGCSVLATDLEQDAASSEGWVGTNEHAAGLQHLNGRGLCGPGDMAQRVGFRVVDMRAIPEDLGRFDFLWSSCAIEHLGSLRHGMDFVAAAMRHLVPGGVAVHTTELNCDSDERTIERGHDVIFRKKDLLQLARELEADGHRVEPFDFFLGDTEEDARVDEPPYNGPSHIKLRIGGFASTSFGLIITAGGR